ncbi:MAG: hypothetical protein ACM3RX_02105, partial [Methanococcaceae archaeon]
QESFISNDNNARAVPFVLRVCDIIPFEPSLAELKFISYKRDEKMVEKYNIRTSIEFFYCSCRSK